MGVQLTPFQPRQVEPMPLWMDIILSGPIETSVKEGKPALGVSEILPESSQSVFTLANSET